MTIINEIEPCVTELYSLVKGSMFLYKNQLYLLTAELPANSEKIDACHVASGRLVSLSPILYVTPVDVEINIKYKYKKD